MINTSKLKYFVWICISMVLINFSCNSPSGTASTFQSTRLQDSTDIAHVIHGFYQWHHSKSTDSINDYNFVDDSGDRYRLKLDLLQIYLDKLYASGYLSRSFIEFEKNFYLGCEKLWQNENIGEVPSCMDGDQFFCAQEWDIKFWTQSPLILDHLESDSAVVRMIGISFDTPLERKFSLIREDDFWKLAYIECDRG